jgi:hypothetical protein
MGWEGTLQPICGGQLDWAVAALPGESYIIWGTSYLIIMLIKRPRYALHMLFRYGNVKLAIEICIKPYG